MKDEVTGLERETQKRWEPTDGPDVPFSHIVVSCAAVAGVGVAYSVGSQRECKQWQLEHGMRASTAVIPL